ncbi:MAG: hypothetical protein AB8B82_01690 [Roseovarius sp.]
METTLIKQNEDGPSCLSTSITALEHQLADMRVDLQLLYDRIRAGELGELTNATKAISEIRAWLKIAIEAEATLEKRNKHDRGIVHDYAIDFDAARSQIGGRLDRLRRQRDAEGVSEEPDGG